MTDPLDIDAIRARLAKATPGPWRWWGHEKGPMCIVSLVPGGGLPFVMGFKRLGMREAQPTFSKGRTPDGIHSGLMTPASEMAVREVSYRTDIVGIDHPDAEFIAHAPADTSFLLEHVHRLRGALDQIARVSAWTGLVCDTPRRRYIDVDLSAGSTWEEVECGRCGRCIAREALSTDQTSGVE